MKIALLGNAGALHTVRWANGLSREAEVHLITAHSPAKELVAAVTVHQLPFRPTAGYLLNWRAVRRMLDRIGPEILNAHYASGYGTLGRLAGFHPYVLSVWGSDVFDFPTKSTMAKWLLQSNLRAPDGICSISEVMAEQCRRLAPDRKDIEVIPWGVDPNRFRPRGGRSPEPLVVGTVKTLARKYGIDTLIKGFAQFTAETRRVPGRNSVKLRIVGGGPDRKKLEDLAASLGVAEATEFAGPVPHECVPEELATLDIFVAVSRLDSESFGVAVVEASACGIPVVVSDAGGLSEVVVDGITGFVVPRENPTALAAALSRLAGDPDLRKSMGAAGRRRVEEKFVWQENVREMYRYLSMVRQEYQKTELGSDTIQAG